MFDIQHMPKWVKKSRISRLSFCRLSLLTACGGRYNGDGTPQNSSFNLTENDIEVPSVRILSASEFKEVANVSSLVSFINNSLLHSLNNMVEVVTKIGISNLKNNW